MLLYHGTSLEALQKIVQFGIKPRKHKPGNWKEFPSRSGFVYLTVAYPLYFAICATTETENKVAIVEIDTNNLRQTRLCPDEDFLGQVRAKQEKLSLEEATKTSNPLDYRILKDNAGNIVDGWKLSLKHLGNCCYYGTIPVNALTRYAIIDINQNYQLGMMGLDPTISLINYSLVGDKYISLVEHIFDGKPIRNKYMDISNVDEAQNDPFFENLYNDAKAFQEETQVLRQSTINVVNLK